MYICVDCKNKQDSLTLKMHAKQGGSSVSGGNAVAKRKISLAQQHRRVINDKSKEWNMRKCHKNNYCKIQ